MPTHSSSSPNAWIGQCLGDPTRYRLDRRLGKGAVGEVFLAMDMRLGRRVAVKVLQDAFIHSQELLTRFEREIALATALESEHVVKIMDYGITPDEHPFYIMEYLQGETLSQLLGRKGQLPSEQAVSIALQLCAGLKIAHAGVALWQDQDKRASSERVKVVHRDLKPDNIFLIPTPLGDLVKILDFGIAKKLYSVEQPEQTMLTQAFLGTARYAAPEQLSSVSELDERADLYSLGVILYEMLSGHNPFRIIDNSPYSEQGWAVAHTSIAPVPLQQQPNCDQISADLAAIVMRCLHKHPAERFASADQLSQALQNVRDSLATSSPFRSAADAPQNHTLLHPVTQYPLVAEAAADRTTVQFRSAASETFPDPSRSDQPIANQTTPPANNSADFTIAQLPNRSIPLSPPPDATIAQQPRQPVSLPDATVYQPKRSIPQPESDMTQVQGQASPQRPGSRVKAAIQRRVNLLQSHSAGTGPLSQMHGWLRSSAVNYVDRFRYQASANARQAAYRWLAHLLPVGVGLTFGLASLSGAYFLLRKGEPPQPRPSIEQPK